MKYKHFLFAMIFSFSVAAAETQDLTDLAKPLNISPEQNAFTLKLKSNRTTGYEWVIKDYDPQLLTLISHHYEVTNKDKQLVGAPGIEEWTFRINPNARIAPRMTQISLVYARPWELSSLQQAPTTISVVLN
jgi:predicted secreted protein